jgi:hypothetical protein
VPDRSTQPFEELANIYTWGEAHFRNNLESCLAELICPAEAFGEAMLDGVISSSNP